MSVVSSGSEVAAATRIAPIHIPPRPVPRAITSPSRARRMPAPATAPALSRKISQAGMVRGLSSSSCGCGWREAPGRPDGTRQTA